MTKRLVIVGAGGLAREVRWIVEDLNRVEERFQLVGHLVADASVRGKYDSVEGVLGDDRWLEAHASKVDALAIAIGAPLLRRAIGERLAARFPALAFPALVHPSVIIDHTTCSVADGAIISAGVIATVNVRVGRFAKVDTACTLAHEVQIGAGAVLNPGAHISGGVTIGDAALIGTGAQILQYLTIGDAATVAAGAVVTRDVAPGTTVVGVPARPR